MTLNEYPYFQWLCDIIRMSDSNMLLEFLYNTPYIPYFKMDENRAGDGKELRTSYMLNVLSPDEAFHYEVPNNPCNMLEMLIALATRMENTAEDPAYGDRTKQWFWDMVVTMGLGEMVDSEFDPRYVSAVIERFLNNAYAPNGKGGLFYVEENKRDMRKLDVWMQANIYLNHVLSQ